jgi:hypothetical protein
VSTRPASTTPFRGIVRLDRYPYCPVCGDALPGDRWNSVAGVAICPNGACLIPQHHKQIIEFILSKAPQLPLVCSHGLIWYVPFAPRNDRVAVLRATVAAKQILDDDATAQRLADRTFQPPHTTAAIGSEF